MTRMLINCKLLITKMEDWSQQLSEIINVLNDELTIYQLISAGLQQSAYPLITERGKLNFSN
ncbi:hypothetical protein ACHCAL_19390 [Providencia huaxiensis]|uniref:hypothetical protein n=1 Tax=Providencia huaxiensis TaxID=2027290 RepID=UPI0037576D9C